MTILTPDLTTISPAVQLDAEYEVAGDFAADANGRLRGVWLTEAGAWAGTVDRDALGTFVSVAMDENGMVPAHPAWYYGIERRLDGIAA